eukprot:scpid38811/ scgid23782/ 
MDGTGSCWLGPLAVGWQLIAGLLALAAFQSPTALSCEPYSWLESTKSGDHSCTAAGVGEYETFHSSRINSSVALYKLVVDLHVDNDTIYSGGMCPGWHRSSGVKMQPGTNAGVPLVWALTTESFGTMLLTMASCVSQIYLYSASSMGRKVKAAPQHLQVKVHNKTCADQLNSTARINELTHLIIKHLGCRGFLLRSQKSASKLWYHTPSRSESRSKAFPLAISQHSFEYAGCNLFPRARNMSLFQCIDRRNVNATQQYRTRFRIGTLCLNIFVLGCVFFLAPLPPLRLMSFLLNKLQAIIDAHHRMYKNHSLTCTKDSALSLPMPTLASRQCSTATGASGGRTSAAYHHQRCSAGCQIFDCYRLGASMPSCFRSSQVWPMLGLLTSENVKNCISLALCFFVYIGWPIVDKLVLMKKYTLRSDAPHHVCEWIEPGYQGRAAFSYEHVFVPFILMAPPVFLIARICMEKRRRLYLVESSAMQDERRRKELRCATACKIADGSLKVQPWSSMTCLLHALLSRVGRRILLDFPCLFVNTNRAVFRYSPSSVPDLIRCLAVALLLPLTALVSLFCVGVCLAGDVSKSVYDLVLLALQSVPLLRLSTLTTFGAVWPLFDLEGSILAPLFSLALCYPLLFTFNFIFQDIFLYTFFTLIGLIINYNAEVVIFVSIFSTVGLRLRRQYHQFYEPFISIHTSIVDHYQQIRFDQLVDISKRLMNSPLADPVNSGDGCTTNAFVQPVTEQERDSELLRLIAAETFLVLSYEKATSNIDTLEIPSVLEDLPWRWCNFIAAGLETALAKLRKTVGSSGNRRQAVQVLNTGSTVRLVRISNPARHQARLLADSGVGGNAGRVSSSLVTSLIGGGDDAANGNSARTDTQSTGDYQAASELLLEDSYLYCAVDCPSETSSSSDLAESSLHTRSSHISGRLCRMSSRCSHWREMEDVLKKLIREKTLSSVAYAVFQAVLFIGILCFLLEFDKFLQGGQAILKIFLVAIPLADYAWHCHSRTSYALKNKLVEKFNDLLQQEL